MDLLLAAILTLYPQHSGPTIVEELFRSGTPAHSCVGHTQLCTLITVPQKTESSQSNQLTSIRPLLAKCLHRNRAPCQEKSEEDPLVNTPTTCPGSIRKPINPGTPSTLAAGQQPQLHPPPGTPEAAGDQAAHSVNGIHRLTPCLSGPSPTRGEPSRPLWQGARRRRREFDHILKAHKLGHHSGTTEEFQRSSGCLDPINRSCGDLGLHSHIVEPRMMPV